MRRPFASYIPPRRIRFKRKDPQKYWHHGCPIYTYHFNALALLVPVFENMVIGSVRKVHRKIKDERLLKEVNSLILQEANHSGEFVRFNQTMITPYYGQELFMTKLGLFRYVINKMPQSFQLAASAFGEHLATVSSEFILEDARWMQGVSKEHADIWRWHSIEEIEHKAVAFDVYKYFKGNYFTRTSALIVFLVLLLYQYFSMINQMMKKDKVPRLKGFIKLNVLYWIRPRFFGKFILPLLGYFRPFFHPNQRQNLSLASHWRPMLKPYQP